ncbi:GNAT family N-acetyltransferase [Natrinema marinum]|uniref:GNAT family N-acetyltransferase n=1 Tax=Natrinema marinum TaxID=2961598 RepID=UPI0020C8F01D|nr:GNAT family N-acetyltransferase [Natrinema marinum]
MSVYPAESFADDVQRRVYEYVERNGAVAPAELERSIRIETGRPDSKPARSGAYTETVPAESAALESCIEALKADGYLTEDDGRLRVALSATPTDLECEDGSVTIRPAREEDRSGIVETMRAVAADGTYVVAENVAAELERESALVRANEERSRVFFVAVREPEAGADEAAEGENDDVEDRAQATDGEVVGWLHIDAPELPSLRHTAELTVGVDQDYRRQEIGSSLLEYGREWAADEGYRKIYQHVPATNETALEFLEANGWQREGEHEGQYCIDDEFVDEIMLATWLDG